MAEAQPAEEYVMPTAGPQAEDAKAAWGKEGVQMMDTGLETTFVPMLSLGYCIFPRSQTPQSDVYPVS